MYDKRNFIKSLMDPEPEDLELVQIDLDIADLTICDILRNLNSVYPENCRDRFAMKDGRKMVAIICKSDLLDPLSGIVLIVGKDPTINTTTKNYLVLSIDESDITTEETLNVLNDEITKYMIESVSKGIPLFEKFYCRYMYNDYEADKND